MLGILRWLRYLLAGLLIIVAAAAIGIYGFSEYKLRRGHAQPPAELAVPSDPGSIRDGERLARLRGCYGGCHADLEGGVMFDDPLIARVVAPNLTQAADRYDTEALVRIIRHGIRPDGRSTTGMPSDMFHHLSDRDLGRIIAFIQNARPVDNELPTTKLRLMGRLMIALGEFEPDAYRVASLEAREPAPEPGPTSEYGRYLAMTTCTECHGMRLEGGFGGQAPPLTIAKGYDAAAFNRLMREGMGLGDRDLGVMTGVAKGRFSRFTDTEVTALHEFLTQAELPLPDSPR